GKDGKRYHALDPEAYAWVHITGFDATLRMHELFGTAPTREERTRMFHEWRQIGAMLGIRDQDIPGTEEEYWKHFESMIDNRLIIGDVVQDLLSDRHYYEQPKPPLQWLSESAWRLSLEIIGPMMRMLTIGGLPKRFRERFDIPWSASDERRFRLFCALVRVLHPLVPHDRRYIPLARRAMRDARKHPEAYEMPPVDAPEPATRLSPA
ncbi:MAG: DUF2236 domain-containing protein, partial [Polyangiaceae bacterium]|nr:DUF2236 domain-containing protein [Polyangiaceae bacterium]